MFAVHVKPQIMNGAFLQLLHSNKKKAYSYPDKESSEDFIHGLFEFLFNAKKGGNTDIADLQRESYSLHSYLATLIYENVGDEKISQEATEQFFDALPGVYETLLKDAETIFDSDPAATSIQEVINAYPGFFAIAVYRIAHILYSAGLKQLARLLTEYAHNKTGIDIHPGAAIGSHFFIDHGTGIVIGETAVIGSHVKIYQGVTVGAFAEQNGKVSGKRHPTIEDDVIIYANATILGGNTVVHRGSIIGANVWITESIEANSFVYQKNEVTRLQPTGKIFQRVGDLKEAQ